jgi:hypothetical protein
VRVCLRLVMVILVSCAVVVGAEGASANGGNTIAGAPQVPLGQHVVAGKTGYDFWRVQLNPGDFLTIDFGAVGDNGVSVCLFKPNVTDYTRVQSDCTAYGHANANGKNEFRFKATLAGSWIIAFYSDGCGQSWDQCPYDVAYEMTTTVRVYTHLSLTAPRSVRAGGFGTLKGQLEGAANGNVQLQAHYRGRWQRFATVRAGASGSFAYRTRFRHRGTVFARAFFAGDSAHLACKSKTVAVHVT